MISCSVRVHYHLQIDESALGIAIWINFQESSSSRYNNEKQFNNQHFRKWDISLELIYSP